MHVAVDSDLRPYRRVRRRRHEAVRALLLLRFAQVRLGVDGVFPQSVPLRDKNKTRVFNIHDSFTEEFLKFENAASNCPRDLYLEDGSVDEEADEQEHVVDGVVGDLLDADDARRPQRRVAW